MRSSLLRSKTQYSTSTLRCLLRPTSLLITPRGISVRRREHGARGMSSNRVFQLRVDPLTGDSEWVVVEEGGGEGSEPGPLLAATSYLDMLNDRRRNRAFRLAIEKTLRSPCHVLDIGAGTGLLSMMAARAMGGRGRVSACESYLPMGKLARRVLRDNGMEKLVRVFHKRSDELRVGTDIDSRADVLVSEILDSELLGEGLIPTLQQAHDMLLVENARTVPFRATTYGQLVEGTFLWRLHDLYSSEVFASDGIHLSPAGMERIVHVKPQQYAMHCNAIAAELRLLSEPFKIFEFDFWKRPDSHGETEMQIRAIDDGNIHAIISWWVLQFDHEGSIFYSTAPKWISSSRNQDVPQHITGGEDWCDHWKQCVWFTCGKGIPVSKDEKVLLQAIHDDISISYFLKFDGQAVSNSLKTEDSDLLLSPEKIALYGDKDWRSAMSIAIRNATRSSPFCVVADDSVFMTILAMALLKNSNVISFFPGLKEKGTLYLQAVAEANGFSMDRVKVIGRRTSCLDKDDIDQRKVDLLLGEPFYYGNEGSLPWKNLRFWKERTLLDPILSEDVVIMPCKGILRACAMYLPNLWRSRCRLESIEGFDHSSVNETLGACGNLPPFLEGPCLPYFIWQCGEFKELSEVFSVMDFNFKDPINSCFGKTKIGFSKPGLCHGFALWIDWVMDEKNSIIVSTGPDSRYWKQGVKLLSKPVAVGEYCSAEIEASFEPSTGELTMGCSFAMP